MQKTLKEQIIEILSFKKGEKFSQNTLAMLCHTSSRKIRSEIENINKTIDFENTIILSGQKGFWITEDKKEIYESVKHIKSQALKMLKRYHTTVKKAGFPETNLFDMEAQND